MSSSISIPLTFDKQWADPVSGQITEARIRGSVQVAAYLDPSNQFVVVSLDGSEIAASTSGQMAYNQQDQRGYFLESCVVTISMSDAAYLLNNDSPTTTMGASATTSSAGFSVNASGGMFGEVGTLNVGGSVDISHSFTRDLTDVKIINISSNTVATHEYKMANSVGGAYSKPDDLINHDTSHNELFGIPDIVVADMPLLSQAAFVSPNNPDAATLTIAVQINLMSVKKTYEVVRTKIKPSPLSYTLTYPVVIQPVTPA